MKININIFINFCSYLASNILGASRNVSIREYMDVRTILRSGMIALAAIERVKAWMPKR